MEKGSLYIHVPFCVSKCVYCDFFSRTNFNADVFSNYTDSLLNELLWLKSKTRIHNLSTIYIGGGTPSVLGLNNFNKIFSFIKNNFSFSEKDFECTVELNPDDVSPELINFFEKSFVTRISLGVQSLNEKTLYLMKRRSTRETALNALALIKKNFSKRFSVDLIAGFPGDKKTDLINSIKEISDFNPEHISLYSLCVEEGTPLYAQIESGELDYDFDYSDQCWLSGKEYLEKLGYVQYEISNFAKSEKAFSRHNLVYWNLNNYIGCGSGATGSFFNNDNSGIRFTGTDDILKFIDFWKDKKNPGLDFSDCPFTVEKLNPASVEYEFFMMGLRLSRGVSEKEYEKRFNKNIGETLGEKSGLFSDWKEKGLAEVYKKNGERFFRLTEKGRLFLNRFLEALEI